MKRIIYNIILLVGFILLSTAIVLPFAAKLKIEQAKLLEESYRWGNADKTYQQTIKIDPLNSEHYKQSGIFIENTAFSLKDKVTRLKQAKEMYGQALNLNPRDAELWYLIGNVRLEVYRILDSSVEGLPQNDKRYDVQDDSAEIASVAMLPRKDRSKARNDNIEEVMDNFRKAIVLDPYSYRNNHLIGQSLLKVWNSLNENQKEFALDKLRYILESKPWYGKHIYPLVWEYTKDSELLHSIIPYSALHPRYSEEEKKERTGLLRRLRLIAKTGELQGWAGKSKNGKSEYKKGNMYWTGTVHKAIEMPEAKTMLKIKVKGSQANNVWPYMIVELDGEAVGEMFVDNSDWKECVFEVNTEGGIKILSVTFANDETEKANGKKIEDRNLYVGGVTIKKVEDDKSFDSTILSTSPWTSHS